MKANATDTFVTHQTVHIDMLDLLGILHNSAYILLFERARTTFWKSLGIIKGPESLVLPHVVARNEINYRAPIIAPQEVQVAMWITHIGNTSLTMEYTITMEDGTLSADGKAVLVRVDAATKRPTPWPEDFRAHMAPYTKQS